MDGCAERQLKPAVAPHARGTALSGFDPGAHEEGLEPHALRRRNLKPEGGAGIGRNLLENVRSLEAKRAELAARKRPLAHAAAHEPATLGGAAASLSAVWDLLDEAVLDAEDDAS